MESNHILVRFGELTTKGKNRKLFIRKLCNNTKEILSSFKNLKYELTFDRMYILGGLLWNSLKNSLKK